MDTEVKLKPTCRCCLSEDGQMKNMQIEKFTFKSEKILLIDGFTACSGVNLNEECEDTCRTVCTTCEHQLRRFYEFREMCKVSTQTIRERFDIKQETLSNGGDEVIYTDYLPYEGSEGQSTTKQPEVVKNETGFVINPVVEIQEGVEPLKVTTTPDDIKRESDDNASSQPDEPFAQDDISESDSDGRKHKHHKSHKRKKVRIKQEDEEPEDDETSAAANAEVANMEANFMCYHCDQFLPTHAQYISHRQNHLWNRSPSRIERTCYVCGQSVYGYLKHIEEHHKDFRPNTCKLCDKGGFQKQNALKMHLFSHTTNTEFECLACHQKFKNRVNLRHHIAYEKHAKHSYHCPYCGLPFKKFLALNDHFKLDHDDQAARKLFPCFKCKKIYMFQKFILEHQCDADTKKVSKKRPKKTSDDELDLKSYKCERCNVVFDTREELVCHQYSVCLEDPTFVCPICKKEFVNQRRLTEHKRTHQNRVFVCDECGHCTTSEPKLLNHKIVHSTERLSKCQECPATFKDGRSLKKHMQIHEERRYECDLCSKKFRNYHNIKQHLATHVKTSALRKFTCDFCDKTFLRGRDRERHLKVHTDERPMKCNLCPKEFRDTGTLNEHYRRTHEGIYYECKYCSKKYTARLKLRDHLFVHRGFKPYNCVECPQQFTKKYLYVKHLLVHNITYVEKIHGYRETENLRDLLAESIRIPNQNTNTIHHHLPANMELDSAPNLQQQPQQQQPQQQQQQPGCSYVLQPSPHLLQQTLTRSGDDKGVLTSMLQLQ